MSDLAGDARFVGWYEGDEVYEDDQGELWALVDGLYPEKVDATDVAFEEDLGSPYDAYETYYSDGTKPPRGVHMF